jgi:prolyl oligopeptidase
LGSSLREDTGFSFSFTSFLYPGTVYWYDLKEGKQIIFGDSKIEGFDPSLFQTEQIFSTSKDGVKIPSFVVRPKTVELNGKNPCLLYGYGGFNISLLPYFSPSRIVWMQNFNGIMVVANLRGGEEYGEAWHEGGIKKNKQNVFNDFIATAENLVNLKYTNPKQLAIVGGSNGGLLVCACVNQRPDLFGCGVSQVGVLDMLRFHKFTIGHAWVSDYGCADNAEDFEYIYKYSPLHTVKKGKEFPALLLTTGDHDDRVVPAHSFKYIAEVQHQLGKEEYQKNPLVVRIEVKAGHGHGKPMDKIIAESADTYAFIAKYTGAQWRN